MTDRVYIESYIPGVLVPAEEHDTYCHLAVAQPLLLHTTRSLVRFSTLLGERCGWLATEDAPRVLTLIKEGHLLLCRTNGPCACLFRKVVIWSEGTIDDYRTEFVAEWIKGPGRIKVPLTDEARNAVVAAWNRLWNQYFGFGAGHS